MLPGRWEPGAGKALPGGLHGVSEESKLTQELFYVFVATTKKPEKDSLSTEISQGGECPRTHNRVTTPRKSTACEAP